MSCLQGRLIASYLAGFTVFTVFVNDCNSNWGLQAGNETLVFCIWLFSYFYAVNSCTCEYLKITVIFYFRVLI